MVNETYKRFMSLIPDSDKMINRVKVFKADIEHLYFLRDHYFDFVIASCVMHLIEDPFRVAHEVKRYMKPDGVFLVSFSAKLSAFQVTNVFNGIISKYVPETNYRSSCFAFAEEDKLGKNETKKVLELLKRVLMWLTIVNRNKTLSICIFVTVK